MASETITIRLTAPTETGEQRFFFNGDGKVSDALGRIVGEIVEGEWDGPFTPRILIVLPTPPAAS